jgi:hypothetical protein
MSLLVASSRIATAFATLYLDLLPAPSPLGTLTHSRLLTPDEQIIGLNISDGYSLSYATFGS